MRVHVHAWEYVNPGLEPGGFGCEWYESEADARKAFYESAALDYTADFLFALDVAASDREAVTAEIDSKLADLCAAATERRIGKNVLAYWKANGFKMGDAASPAA